MPLNLATLQGTYTYSGSIYTLDLNLVISDTANADGSYTVVSGNGTDTNRGTTYNVTIDPAGTDSNGVGGTNDNHISFMSPYLSTNGLGINLYDIKDHADLFFTGSSNILRDATSATAPLDIAISPVCYASGTLIRTSTGEVAVEALAIGDLVVTASGALRPIRWIGHRAYDARFAGANPDVMPVCFKAGSIADGVPARDLWVSPRHAMFLEGTLVPAQHLVNGTSIVKTIRTGRLDYFHVELDSHDVLLAEGAPSESFVDDDSRGIFQNVGDFAEWYPDAVRADAIYCAPRLESGYRLEAIRRRLAARAPRDAMGAAA